MGRTSRGALLLLAGALLANGAAADDVSVALKGGTLSLVGDADGNEVEVTQSGPTYTVTGQGGTSLNGGFVPLDFTDVTGITARNLGGPGDSELEVDGVVLSKNVSYDGGSAHGWLTLKNVSMNGNVAAKKADQVSLDGLDILGGVKIQSGDGSFVEIKNASTIDGNVQIKSKGGSDDVSVTTSSEIGGNLKIQTGNVSGFVNLADSIVHGKVSIKSGSGPDEIAFNGAQLNESVKLDLGKGVQDTVRSFDGSQLMDDLSIKSGADQLDVELTDSTGVQGSLKASGKGDTWLWLVGVFGPVRGDSKGGLDATVDQSLIQGDLRLRAGGGDFNDLYILDTSVTGDVSVSSKDATDFFDIRDGSPSVGGRVSASLGGGNNSIFIKDASIGDDLRVTTKNEQDSLLVEDSEIDGGVQAKLGKDSNLVEFNDSDVAEKALFSFGDGLAEFYIRQSSHLQGDVIVNTGNQQLLFELNASSVGGDLKAKSKKTLQPGDVDFFEVFNTAQVDGDLSVDLGPGSCDFALEDSTVFGDVSFKCKESTAESCQVEVNDSSIVGDSRIQTGSSGCFHTVVDSDLGGLDLNAGAGNDNVDLDTFGTSTRTLFQGPVKIQMGAGDDFLTVGGASNGNFAGQFGAAVTFDGGSGDDTLDYEGHGNLFDGGNPTIKGFETVE